MNKRWSGISTVGRRCFVVASILSLGAQMIPLNPCFAGTNTKNMQIPVIEEKLDDNGSTDSDKQINEAKSKADLTPLTLTSTSQAKTDGGASDTTSSAGNNGEVLKSTVSETDFVPKGPVDKGASAVPPVSIRDSVPSSLDEKLIKDAHKTNVLPLALMESRDEADKKIEARFEAEKAQLTDLWNATLTRSPDIQFVTQKLLPTSQPGHTTAIMMKFLTAAMFGAMGAATMVSPNMGTMAVTNMGGNMIAQVLGAGSASAAKKARLSQTETIMLYNMVRTTADRLVESYRCYRKELSSLKLAEADLTEMQNMVRDTRSTQSAPAALEMEYTLRKAQRDINAVTEDVRKYRQSLTDLAGADAVAKLDKQFDDEQLAIDPAIAEAQKEGALGGPIEPIAAHVGLAAAKVDGDAGVSADLPAKDALAKGPEPKAGSSQESEGALSVSGRQERHSKTGVKSGGKSGGEEKVSKLPSDKGSTVTADKVSGKQQSREAATN